MMGNVRKGLDDIYGYGVLLDISKFMEKQYKDRYKIRDDISGRYIK